MIAVRYAAIVRGRDIASARAACLMTGPVAGIRTISCFFFQAEDGIRDLTVTGVQTCALPISRPATRCRRRVKRDFESMRGIKPVERMKERLRSTLPPK